jgi:hypothetical protein
LRDATLPVADRLRAVVTGLEPGPLRAGADNLESNLDEGSRQILDAELAGSIATCSGTWWRARG